MGKHIPGKPTVVLENMTGVLELLPVRSLIHLFKPNPNAFPRLELTHRDLFILQHDALDHARVNTKS